MKKNGLPILLLVVCLLLFGVYWVYDARSSDRTPPKISIVEPDQLLMVSVWDPQTVLLQGVNAEDNTDGDVTGYMIVEGLGNLTPDGKVTVTYAAFDKSGNVAKATRVVQFTDYEGPRFTLENPLVYRSAGAMDVMANIGAQDALDGTINHRVKATLLNQTSITTEGIHQVQFRVTNSLGDTEQVVLPVEVYNTAKYQGEVTLTEYLIYCKVGDRINPEDYLESFSVYGQKTDLRGGVPADLQLQIEGQVNVREPGVYPVSFTVSKQQNNQILAGYSKLIVIVEE